MAAKDGVALQKAGLSCVQKRPSLVKEAAGIWGQQQKQQNAGLVHHEASKKTRSATPGAVILEKIL